MGVGIGAASADVTTDSSKFGGTWTLALTNNSLIPQSTVIPWTGGVRGLVPPGTTPAQTVEAPAGTSVAYRFITVPGTEDKPSLWNAYALMGPVPEAGLLQPNFNLSAGFGTNGDVAPKGADAIKALGGEYSVGVAFVINGTPVATSDIVDAGLYFYHVTITPGTGTYTWTPVVQDVVQTDTETTITTAPATVTSGDTFSLSATVSPAPTDGGTVTFKDGANTIGTATVTGGVATLPNASLANPGTSDRNASVTAVYAGDSAFSGSTSAPVVFVVHPGDINTATAVTAISASGNENRPVVLTATVSPVSTSGAGSVVFTGSLDGAAATTIAGPIPVSATGVATTTISSLTAGDWTINAEFTGVAPYQNSASATAASLTLAVVTVPSDQREDPQDVVVAIPEGTLAITTPYTAADPLDLGTAVLDDATSTYFTDPTVFGSVTDQAQAIQVIDRRSGGHGFTAQVRSTDFASTGDSFSASFASLTDVVAHQVTGNTLLASNVATSDIASLSAADQPFAVHTPTAGHETGTVWFSAELALTNVPSSVQPGQYRATLTFTAL